MKISLKIDVFMVEFSHFTVIIMMLDSHHKHACRAKNATEMVLLSISAVRASGLLVNRACNQLQDKTVKHIFQHKQLSLKSLLLGLLFLLSTRPAV